jgi:GNAT superfamily N-acetyltransferase
MRITLATFGDLPALQDIEIAAGRHFIDFGMPEVAADDPPAVAELDEYRRAGRAWVAVSPSHQPMAYLIAKPVDSFLHIEQVSVHPDYGGRRIGARLIDHAADHARHHGIEALTLTTFSDVPWNAAYYRRCGFRTMPTPP